jgi:hypothetical protein
VLLTLLAFFLVGDLEAQDAWRFHLLNSRQQASAPAALVSWSKARHSGRNRPDRQMQRPPSVVELSPQSAAFEKHLQLPPDEARLQELVASFSAFSHEKRYQKFRATCLWGMGDTNAARSQSREFLARFEDQDIHRYLLQDAWERRDPESIAFHLTGAGVEGWNRAGYSAKLFLARLLAGGWKMWARLLLFLGINSGIVFLLKNILGDWRRNQMRLAGS